MIVVILCVIVWTVFKHASATLGGGVDTAIAVEDSAVTPTQKRMITAKIQQYRLTICPIDCFVCN